MMGAVSAYCARCGLRVQAGDVVVRVLEVDAVSTSGARLRRLDQVAHVRCPETPATRVRRG